MASVASHLRTREPLCRSKEFVDSAESFDACMAEGFRGIDASGSVYGRDDADRWTALYHQGTMVKAGDEESERGRGA